MTMTKQDKAKLAELEEAERAARATLEDTMAMPDTNGVLEGPLQSMAEISKEYDGYFYGEPDIQGFASDLLADLKAWTLAVNNLLMERERICFRRQEQRRARKAK